MAPGRSAGSGASGVIAQSRHANQIAMPAEHQRAAGAGTARRRAGSAERAVQPAREEDDRQMDQRGDGDEDRRQRERLRATLRPAPRVTKVGTIAT